MERTILYNIEKHESIRKWLLNHFSVHLTYALLIDNCYVNGIKATRKTYLKEGDELKIVVKETTKPTYKAVKCDFSIEYEDDDILVVKKGKHIACVPTRAHYEDNLLSGLLFLRPDLVFRTVTRLDKDTEGLVLIAKNALSHSLLTKNMTNISREYIGLVEGEIIENRLIDTYLSKSESMKRFVSDSGEKAITEIIKFKQIKNNTLVRFKLYTGRTHQIRVHSSYIGHPLVGDTLYGNGKGEYNSGQTLACVYLKFVSPINKKTVEIDISKEIIEKFSKM